jgi:hypothetical protein
MNLFRSLFEGLRTSLTTYTFSSDHRVDLVIIEEIRRHYGSRTGAGNPYRYLWRSVCQYRCQSYARSKLTAIAANIAALLATPLLVLLVRAGSKNHAARVSCQYLKIDFHAAYQIPEGIRGQTVENGRLARYLTVGDLVFALRAFLLCRAFYPELLFKFLLWIASVRPHLDRFEMRYLLQYCEYSAYSSLRKFFLNSHGIRIANVTHGEEFISCRSAFSSFDQYYAWQLTPQSIHEAMHIEYAERFTFNPCAGLPHAPAVAQIRRVGFLWPAIDASNLDQVVAQINELSACCEVIVRPHPNSKYTNHFEAHRDRLIATVSDAHAESIHSFIDRSTVIVGYLSAVLLQAVFRGREVVYLQDPYLVSLQVYHDYYRSVNAVELAGLARYVWDKFFEDCDK